MEIDCKICKVRSWKISDIDSLSYHANNRKIWLNLRDAFPFPYSKLDAINFIRRARSVYPETYFAIDFNGKAIGSIGFRPGKDIEKVSAEIGYWLGEEFWGRGITTAALIGLTLFAIQQFKLCRIFAVPFADNPASFRVLEKAGYRREGIMHKSCIKDGKIKDQILYSYVV
jgi:ribosomal-protein-alanine N-acetyltransferase